MIEQLWRSLADASFNHARHYRHNRTLKWKGYKFSHHVLDVAEQNHEADIERMTLILKDQEVVIEAKFDRGPVETIDGAEIFASPRPRYEWIDRPTDENFVLLKMLL